MKITVPLGHVEIIRLLLSFPNANVDVFAQDGMTALFFAVQVTHK
jgi:hypothetical protein